MPRRLFALLLALAACGGKFDFRAENSPGAPTGESHLAVDAGPDATEPGGNDLRSTRGTDAAGGTDGGANASQPVATSYLINPAHTGFAPASTLRPPLARLWSTTLSGAASYPLIADGRVFVVSENTATQSGMEIAGPSLVALDAQTGAVLWSAHLASSFAAHAYEGGRVFAIDGSGGVTAFDAATGAAQWTRSMAGPDITDFATIPTAYGGVLYTAAAGTGGTIFAYDEATGVSVFQISSPYWGDGSPPALDDHGLVVGYGCEQTYALDRLTGASLWHYSTSCGGGGADVPVLQGGEVYVADPMANVVLSEASGSSVGTFAAIQPPAFDGTYGIFANGTQLTAIRRSTGQTAWMFGEDDGVNFQVPPLIAGGYVYTFDSSPKVRAFDEATGKPAWSDPAQVDTIESMSIAPSALGAAGGLLIVPDGAQVVAYASAPDAGAPAVRASDGGCNWSLQPGQDLTTADSPFGVAMGDFNGDGRPDLAVAALDGSTDVEPWGDGLVSVFLGNGDGTFKARVDYQVGQGAWAIQTADFNGDGVLDLAVVDRGGNYSSNTPAASVSVLLGNGDGTFAPAKGYPTNPYPVALTAADLNGDGALDLALVSDATPNLSLLMGNGDGSFQAPIAIAQPPMAVADGVAAADLNGDGRPDLVTADGEYDVDVFLSIGGGSFATPVAYPSAMDSCCVTEPESVAIADVDGDGKPDLAVANLGTSSVSVFKGNGDGTFQPQVAFMTNRGPQVVAITDINADGHPDLLATTPTSPDLIVLLGNGDGTFQSQIFFGVPNGAGPVAAGDLNGDGLPDAVVINGTDTVSVLLGNCGP